MKNVGIVCEGPKTDYVLLQGIVDLITGGDNQYLALQPEDNLTGNMGMAGRVFGNGVLTIQQFWKAL